MQFFYTYYYKVILTGIVLLFFISFESLANKRLVSLSKMAARVDTVKGTVVDEYGKPLTLAKINLVGKNIFAITDGKGTFSILATLNDQLKIERSGYYQKQLKVNRLQLIIQLYPTFLSASDSVNVGYGRRPLSSILGAVSTINNSPLLSSPTQNLVPGLAGQLVGLNIGQANGYPNIDGDQRGLGINGSFTASIRGYTGRAALGATDLITLVDGAPRPYNSLAPEEIESITLLKDAISTVMYGQRSTPGMLLITTKKGMTGPTRISFSAQTAILQSINLPQTLPAYDYANLYNQTQINSGIAPNAVKYTANALNAYQTGSDPYLFPDVDWKSAILKNTTTQNKINFNIQGSGTGLRYFVSLDYLKDNGLYKTAEANNYNTSPDYSRYTLRSNMAVDFNKTLKLDVGLFGRVEDQTQPGNNDAAAIYTGIFTTPALAYPIQNPNGTFGGNSTYTTNLYARSIQAGYALVNTKNLSFDLGLTQKLDNLLSGLFIKASGNVNVENGYLTQRVRTYAVVPISAGTTTAYNYGTAIGTNSDITAATSAGSAQFRILTSYIEGLAGYDHQFGDHSLSVKLVADQQSMIRDQDLPYKYNTFAGNISYNYQQKYFAEVAGSYGSFNQFDPSHQYEPFYAGALGWNLMQEDFFKNHLKGFTNLKLRVNYGLTGYVNRGNYGYFNYIQRYVSTGTFYYFGNSATSSQGYAENGVANADARGEKARKFNAGVDIALFKDHLLLSADYYINKLYDLWITPGTAYQVLGINQPAGNIGKQDYTGSEFTLTYKNNSSGFNYFASMNLAVAQSKLIYSAETPAPNNYQLVTGLPLGVFSGLTSAGLFRSQAEINSSAVPSDVDPSTIRPGDIKYVDRNNDGVIDSRDAGPVGTTKPQIVYGLTLGGNYKAFDFSLLIQGIQNRQIYNSGDYEWAFRNNGLNNAYPQNLNAYSAANPNAIYPRLTIGTNVNNEKTSDFWLHDAGFARLKNAQIGYTLPFYWTRKFGIPSARIFINGENLLTFSQLNDFGVKLDPEVRGPNYPIQRVINFGVNIKL